MSPPRPALRSKGESDLPLELVHPLRARARRRRARRDRRRSGRDRARADRRRPPDRSRRWRRRSPRWRRPRAIPILAEPTSQLRLGPTTWARRDLGLRRDRARAAGWRSSPELVVRFGDMPTSKALRQWLGVARGHRPARRRSGGDLERADPDRRARDPGRCRRAGPRARRAHRATRTRRRSPPRGGLPTRSPRARSAPS